MTEATADEPSRHIVTTAAALAPPPPAIASANGDERRVAAVAARADGTRCRIPTDPPPV